MAKKSINEVLADAARVHALDLLRLSNGQRKVVVKRLTKLEARMAAEIAAQELDGDKATTRSQKARLNAVLKEVSSRIEEAYSEVSDDMGRHLIEVASYEGEYSTKSINSAGKVALVQNVVTPEVAQTIAYGSIIQGAPSEDWWSRQSDKVTNNFSDQIRKGMDAGDTLQQLVQRVRGGVRDGVVLPGVMPVARRDAEALVRTSVLSVASETRRELYQGNDDVIKGIQQISTLDDRVTLICAAYAGACWDLDYKPIPPNTLPYQNGVPRHWGCRSAETPILKSFAELTGLDIPEPPPSTRAAMDGTVPADIGFDDWLKSKGPDFANALLGETRAQMWRNGDITMTDLVNDRGTAKTIADLRAEAGL